MPESLCRRQRWRVDSFFFRVCPQGSKKKKTAPKALRKTKIEPTKRKGIEKEGEDEEGEKEESSWRASRGRRREEEGGRI